MIFILRMTLCIDLYKANLAAGVDYMEFGYRADKKQFDVNKFGKWKFAEDEDTVQSLGIMIRI